MGRRTSSADPARLDAYRAGAEQVADELLRTIAALDDALTRLARSGSVGLPPAAALAPALRTNAVAHRRLAAWVGEVATAFRRADAGAPPPVARVDDPAVAVMARVLDRVAGAVGAGDVDRLVALLGEASTWVGGADAVATVAAQVPAALRHRMALAHPIAIGPRDGWPPADRYAANRALVGQAVAQATGVRRARLAALLRPDPATGRARQFLAFDPFADGQVVEVFGDLDGADAVAFYVPGMSSDLDHFDARVAGRARSLWEAAAQLHPERSVAVVAWLGYDSPDDLPSTEAASPHLAELGGELLAATIDGLALQPHQRVSIVAHSYGTVVAGSALRDGVRADDLLAMGSPGMGVDRAKDFGRGDATDLFTMETPGDLVTDLEGFGPDPNEPGSGFTRLETGSHGHSGYLLAGTPSLRNAAAVVTGDDEALDRREGSAAERVGSAAEGAASANRVVSDHLDAWQEDHRVPVVGPILDLGQAVARRPEVDPGFAVDLVDDLVDTAGDIARLILG